jgi:hypothetical protein
MAIETYQVQLVGPNGAVSQGDFTLDADTDDDECQLSLQYPGGELRAVACDYFEALCQIRHELEEIGQRPVCYGSSRHVYPSGMSRGMGARGLKAYRLHLGQQAKNADLVEIFAVGSDVEPVSVEEQRAFFENWLESLR